MTGAPDIWPPPTWSTRARHRRGRGLVITAVIAGVLMVWALLGVGAFAVWSTLGDESDDDYPTAWNPAVADLVPEVEVLRDLSFTHPVPVRFLDEDEFRDFVAIQAEELDEDERRDLAEAESTLRSLGLLGRSVDLLDAVDTALQSSVLALYDSEVEEIVVRGTPPLDVSQQVTVVHELVHVLQDQHFDLEALGERVEDSKTGSEDALVALIEGDATRIEDEYVSELGAAEQREVEEQQESELGRAEDELADVPRIVTTLFSAPYAYGPWAIQALVVDGGDSAVDEALERATFTQQIFTDVLSVLRPPDTMSVPRVSVGEGETALGDPETFGAFDLYLVLASRIDPTRALEIAQGWAGGRSRTVTVTDTDTDTDTDGKCMLANIVGVDRAATEAIRDGLEEWASARPEGFASVSDIDGAVGLRACDPGEGASDEAPDAEIERAATVLVLYDSLIVSLFAEATEFDIDLPAGAIECISLSVLRDSDIVELTERPQELLAEEEITAAIEAAIPVALDDCGLAF